MFYEKRGGRSARQVSHAWMKSRHWSCQMNGFLTPFRSVHRDFEIFADCLFWAWDHSPPCVSHRELLMHSPMLLERELDVIAELRETAGFMIAFGKSPLWWKPWCISRWEWRTLNFHSLRDSLKQISHLVDDRRGDIDKDELPVLVAELPYPIALGDTIREASSSF